LVISGGPVKRRRDRTGAGNGADERASDKFSGGVGGVYGSEEMDVNEMVNEVGAEAERAASRQGEAVVGGNGTQGKSSAGRRWNGIAGKQFGSREGSDIIGTKAGSERDAEGGRETVKHVVS
jgi:hypothetical protein